MFLLGHNFSATQCLGAGIHLLTGKPLTHHTQYAATLTAKLVSSICHHDVWLPVASWRFASQSAAQSLWHPSLCTIACCPLGFGTSWGRLCAGSGSPGLPWHPHQSPGSCSWPCAQPASRSGMQLGYNSTQYCLETYPHYLLPSFLRCCRVLLSADVTEHNKQVACCGLRMIACSSWHAVTDHGQCVSDMSVLLYSSVHNTHDFVMARSRKPASRASVFK